MKYCLSVLLLLTFQAQADSLKLTIENFNFSYTNPHGEGSATSFYRNQFLGSDVYVSVDKNEKDFKLAVTGSENQEFTFKNAPSFMTDAQTMEVSGLNLNFADKVGLSLASGQFDNEDKSLSLEGVNLSCARNLSSPDLMDQLIIGCVQAMTLKTSKFSQSDDKSLSHALKMALQSDKSSFRINSFDMKIGGGKYELSADVRAEISGRIKSSGNMSYDSSTGTVTIKVSEIKFGVLSIRGKVFDELEEKQNEKMKVKEPYIYYKIK